MSKNTRRSTEINLSLSDDLVVTNDTVKITAEVGVVLTGDFTNANLSASVTATLRKFIDADWVFSNPRRATEVGIEKAFFTAHVRVPAKENFNLTERAEAVKSRGLEITSVDTDTSIPAQMLREAETTLRGNLLRLAQEQAEKLSKASGGEFHFGVAQINFSQQHVLSSQTKSLRASGSYGAVGASAFSADSMGDDTIGNSEKVGMTATIMLRDTETFWI